LSVPVPTGGSGTRATTATLTVRAYNAASGGTLLQTFTGTATSINTSTFTRIYNYFTFPSGTTHYEIEISCNANMTAPAFATGFTVLGFDYVSLQAGQQVSELLSSAPMEFYLNSSNTSTYAVEVTYNGQDTFTISPGGGLFAAGTATFNRLRINTGGEASLTSTTHGLQIGSSSGLNMRMDGNEIQSSNNGSAATLTIQNDGGNIFLGNSVSDQQIALRGAVWSFDIYDTNVSGSAAERVLYARGNDGAVPYRLGTLSSTRRVKQQITNAESDILNSRFLELEPVKFKYNQAIEELGDKAEFYYGFIAEQAQELGLNFLYACDEGGIADYFAHEKMPVYLFTVVKEQQRKINELEERLAILEG
jgi:hypothetical protein